MTTKVRFEHPKHPMRCRICNEMIPRGAEVLVFSGVRVSPKEVKLGFHERCLIQAVAKAGVVRETAREEQQYL